MHNKLTRKVFALLMVLCMAVTYMPSVAFAADEVSPDPQVTEESVTEEPVVNKPAPEAEEPEVTEEAAESEAQEEAPEAVQEEPAPETETEEAAFDATRADYLSYDPLFISKYANAKYVDASEIDMYRFVNVVTAMKGMVSYNVDTQSKFEVTEDNYIAGMNCEIPVYNIDDKSDYYVAIPDVNKFNKNFKMYDMKVGYNNDYAETISGWKYEKGILYIPKKAVDSPSYSHETPENQMLAIQLNYAIGSDFTKSIPVQVLSKDEPVDKTAHTANLFDISGLTVKTGVKNRSAADIDVFLNGQMIPINSEAWAYNKSTGEISIQALPGVVSNINIVFKQRTTSETVKDATVSAIENVTLNSHAAAGEASDQAGMKFFRDDKGNIVTLDVRRDDIFVGWRGYYDATIHYGRENGQSGEQAEAYKKTLRGWEDSINYLYGGYTTYAGAGSGDDEKYDSKVIPLWSISSYSVGEDLGRSSDSDNGKLTATELVEHHISDTATASKTIYQWMYDNRNKLKQSKKSTGNMEGNGIGGANNFAMNFPKTLTGSSVNLVDPNSPDSGGNAGRANRNITFNLEGINESGYWFAASCNELGKATGGSDGVNKNRVYVTCLGLEKDYAILAFVHNVSGRKQSACAIYKFRLKPIAYAKLKKTAAETDVDFLKEAPNNYSLEGAEYRLYEDSSFQKPATDIKGNAAVLTTDKNGDTNTLEMEPGTYYAKETKASKGFRLDKNVNDGKPIVLNTDINTETNPYIISSVEEPTYSKVAMEINKTSPGDGWQRLIGAKYKLNYYDLEPGTDPTGKEPTRSWTVAVTKKQVNQLENKAALDFATDPLEEGSDEPYLMSENRILPLGVFSIEEAWAPDGLALDDTRHGGKVYQAENGGNASAEFYENGSDHLLINYNEKYSITHLEESQAIKLKINKKDSETGTAQGTDRDNVKGSLAGAVYKVYFDNDELNKYEYVGEIVTNEEGEGMLEKRVTGTIDGTKKTDLEPGTYLIEEVQASPGYTLDKHIYEDKEGEYKDGKHIIRARVKESQVRYFTYESTFEERPHHTHIYKTDATTGEELPGATLQVLDSQGNIVEQWVSTDEPHDIVALHDETQGLKDGKYTLREITAPYGYDIAEDVEFEVKSGEISNKVEMKNKPLTVGTIALDKDTKAHHGAKAEEETIVDTVKVTGLYVGREYQLTGELFNKTTGELLKDKDGNVVKSEVKKFTATADEMEVPVEFTVDSSEFTNDTTLVAYEYLARAERFRDEDSDFPGEEFPKELAKHEDPKDEDQAVHYGGIVATEALDQASKTHNILAGEEVVLVDKVKFENLSPNQEYKLEGELYDKTTGELLGVSAEMSFTPETADGEVEMEFYFDSSELKNHDLVVFETLLVNDIIVHEHKNPDDEKQTVHVPEIKTVATDAKTGEHVSLASKNISIKDTVEYKNLIPGTEYTMTGTLMDKSTGKPVMDNGKAVTASQKFIPEAKDGSVEITFTFNGVKLAGTTVVAFEDCKVNDASVAVHADINDAPQSVDLPKIGTKAALVGKKVKDTVTYENLKPGTYVMKGWLVNTKTGKKLSGSDGEKKFTITDNGSGKIVVELPVAHYGKIHGVKLTAFEELYLVKEDKEILIAEHKDQKDNGQTVKIPGGPKTGDTHELVLYGFVAILAAAALTMISVRRRRTDK